MTFNGRLALMMFGIGMVLVIGIAAPSYAWSPDRMVTQAVIVIDISKSVASPCEAAGKITKEILALPYARSSSMLVLVTGDSSTSNEPRLLGKFPLPVKGALIEGHGRTRQEVRDLPATIIKACLTIGQTDVSPVFLAVKSGLSQLNNFACGKEIRCLLFVASDGEENAERNVRLALDGNISNLTSLKGKLDNTKVETSICGISETVGQQKEKSGTTRNLTKKRDEERSNRLYALWSGLFRDPAHVHIYSFCPSGGR